MDLRRDRKGIVAIVDALVFISILSIAAFGLFAYSGCADTEEPMAESVSNDLFSMELMACDVYRTSDTSIYPLPTLIAVNMASGNTDSIGDFLKDTLDGLVPGYCGYSLTIGFLGNQMVVERQGMNELSSSHSSEFHIAGSEVMTYVLEIY